MEILTAIRLTAKLGPGVRLPPQKQLHRCLTRCAFLAKYVFFQALEAFFSRKAKRRVHHITELVDVGAEPRQLLDLLVERVRGRQKRLRYLEVTDSHLKAVLERREDYMQDLKRQISELKDAVGGRHHL